MGENWSLPSIIHTIFETLKFKNLNRKAGNQSVCGGFILNFAPIKCQITSDFTVNPTAL